MPRSPSGAASDSSVSAASARSGVIHSTRSGGAALRRTRFGGAVSRVISARGPDSSSHSSKGPPPRRERLSRSSRRVNEPALAGAIRAPHLALKLERRQPRDANHPSAAASDALGDSSSRACTRAATASRALLQQRVQRVERVRVGRRLVRAPPQNARKAHGDRPTCAAATPGCPRTPSSNTCSGFTCRTGPNFSIVLRRIQRVELADLRVGQPGVRLRERAPARRRPTRRTCSRCAATRAGRGRPARRSSPRPR